LREQPTGVRAVAVIDPDIADAALDEMHALGVRGVRLNLMSPRMDEIAAVERMLAPIAERVARLGWHLQIYADPGVVAPIVPVIRRLPVPVVLDHMGGVRSSERVDQPDFVARSSCCA
jgi:predicted TIM-barrel fold metal-dependent hydrolase